MIFVLMTLFMNRIRGVFVSMNPSEYDDSFILLNTAHENVPLTLFDYANRDTILPLRMSELTYETLPYQLFKLRYDQHKIIYFTPKIDTKYSSVRNGKFLVASNNMARPNLTLHAITGDHRSNVFKIKSSSQCLTVGAPASYKNKDYWKLEFNTCNDDDKNQEFMFIPHITALSYLQRDSDFDFNERIIKQVYSNLDRTLGYAAQKY